MFHFFKTLFFLFVFFVATTAIHASSNLIITQVYGGGGNSRASYANDFIEIYNSGTDTLNFTGSIQYASASGSSWTVIPIDAVKFPPQQYYLISLATSGTNGDPLPLSDQEESVNISASSGKVILCSDQEARTEENPVDKNIMDKVGYGSATGFEGSAPAPGISNTKSVLRVQNVDTDDNYNDFVSSAPNPRNSSYSPLLVTGMAQWKPEQMTVFPVPSGGEFNLGVPGNIVKIIVIGINGQKEIFTAKKIHTNFKGPVTIIAQTDQGIFKKKAEIF